MNKLLGIFFLALAFLLPVSTGRATLVTLPGPIIWPGMPAQMNSAPGFGTAATVASAQYISYVFVAREDMIVSHVGFRVGAVTATPTAEARIETVDGTTGLPTGTLWATNTNGTTGTLSANTNPLQALTASATITKGQVFCVKIAYASGTSFVVQNYNQITNQSSNLPYIVVNTGTPTKVIQATSLATIALGSSSTTFYNVTGSIPVSTISNNAFNNSTAGSKRGMLFTIPMNCRIVGVRFYNTSSTGDFNVAVFDNAGTELSSSSTAYSGGYTGAGANATTTTYFDNTITVTSGTSYRVAVEPTTATNVNVSTFTLPTVNYRGASAAGTTAQYTTFTTVGGWIDTTTDQVPLMDILIDQIDNGSGTGGSGRIIGG